MREKHLSKKNLIRDKIYIDESFLNGMKFKVAETQKELEESYKLVHDCFVKAGYCEPQASNIKLEIQNALLSTTTFVGKLDDVVKATVTLFQDSSIGLPMDSIYSEELKEFRKSSCKIAQLGHFSSTMDFNFNNFSSLLFIFKLAYNYTQSYFNIDKLLITINPKHYRFYNNILLFKKIGKIKSYPELNNNPAVALMLDINTAEQKFDKVYKNKPFEKNVYNFIYNYSSPSIYLNKKQINKSDWYNLFNYFFKQKTNKSQSISSSELKTIMQQF
jgi:hypothetical protein